MVMVIVPEKIVMEGVLVRSVSVFWTEVVQELRSNWNKAFALEPRIWEELVAGAYAKAGFDEVVLTPRSGDHGRDVIATKRGIGSIRILGSVTAYNPGHLVTKEEVHALAGVVNLDPAA
jgi:restriction system protein